MKKNQKNKQSEMFLAVENWHQSKLSQYRFCKENKMNISTFQYWVKKYRNQGEGITSQMSHQRFLSLEVSEAGQVDTTESFTISYPNGVQLICPSTTNTQTLRNLINL